MNGDFGSSLAIIAATFIPTSILTAWVRRILIRRAVLDHPNERSSHTTPTPRGGGWAIMAVLVPGIIATGFYCQLPVAYLGIIAAVLLLAGISWMDDRKGVNPAIRLGLHIIAAFLGSLCFNDNQSLFSGYIPLWLDRAIMIIGWAWFMNLYNFMDGIDGITGAETISIATGVCLLLAATGMNAPALDTLTLILTGTSLGFLAYNWHPAKIFLGDIGSLPLGFLTGFCLLSIAVNGHLIPALIIPLYYLADSGITIIRRALRGEKVWQAHRQHFYQQAARGLGRHDKVVYTIIFANLGLIGAAGWSVFNPMAGLGLGMVIVALLLGWLHKSGQKNG